MKPVDLEPSPVTLILGRASGHLIMGMCVLKGSRFIAPWGQSPVWQPRKAGTSRKRIPTSVAISPPLITTALCINSLRVKVLLSTGGVANGYHTSV